MKECMFPENFRPINPENLSLDIRSRLLSVLMEVLSDCPPLEDTPIILGHCYDRKGTEQFDSVDGHQNPSYRSGHDPLMFGILVKMTYVDPVTTLKVNSMTQKILTIKKKNDDEALWAQIKEYEKAIEAAAVQISDLRKQLSEYND